MATTATETPESVMRGKTESGGTGVGPGGPPKRRTKARWRILLVVLGLALNCGVAPALSPFNGLGVHG